MQAVDILLEVKNLLDEIFSNQAVVAFVSALLGGWFTSNATKKAHKFNEDKSKKELIENTRNSLKLIKVELLSAWTIFNQEYSPELMALPDGEPYICDFAIGDNPFPIFDSSPSCLANIDPETSEKIVRAYMRVKGLIAMIKHNNENSEVVALAGRVKLDAVLNGNISLTEKSIEEHQEYYDSYVHWEAKKIGMGEYANAMKLLTSELISLHESLFVDIENTIQELS